MNTPEILEPTGGTRLPRESAEDAIFVVVLALVGILAAVLFGLPQVLGR